MAVNGDDILRQHLEENPERSLEWRQAHKLRSDPRVTRVGGILRRTSLDELPQLWNVLRGEMSLAGPRPIVEGEIGKYGAAFAFYCRAVPGITGLWQVSGRNELSYSQRVALDMRYIRDWSLSLDLTILCKTVGAVVSGRGAY
jgi:lipopolysaccharide/colanic/teichoic acid biosynthesis glycosyltransferase